MRVLVLGGGAREHALISRLAADRDTGDLLAAPGNPGIARIARTAPVDLRDLNAIQALADREQIDFTVVGPELPLSLGIADRFAADRRLLFGPTAAAARLESSKAFAKAFMARHGIPTARFRTCESMDAALASVRGGEFGLPVVLKADGLAAGKGVVIADDRATAERAITDAMRDRKFGDAGDRLVIEECLQGPEVSFFCVCDGTRAVPIGAAQDHKRAFDGDRGPNTGGMGAFAPSPLLDASAAAAVMAVVVAPVLRGMRAEGTEYRGFLYAGLMMTCAGPKVIEYNVRFGDPETQVVLPRITSDLTSVLVEVAAGQLVSEPSFGSDAMVTVMMCTEGYPHAPRPGDPIEGLDDRVDDALHRALVDPRHRRIGTHPAGVRALLTVTDALVVLGGREREHPLAVAEAEQRELRTHETFLDDHSAAGIAER